MSICRVTTKTTRKKKTTAGLQRLTAMGPRDEISPGDATRARSFAKPRGWLSFWLPLKQTQNGHPQRRQKPPKLRKRARAGPPRKPDSKPPDENATKMPKTAKRRGVRGGPLRFDLLGGLVPLVGARQDLPMVLDPKGEKQKRGAWPTRSAKTPTMLPC